MASWDAVVTNGGNSLLSTWISGTKLNFDAAEGGTGTVDVAALVLQTRLINKKQDLSILGFEKVSNGIKIKIQITAPDVGYTLNQIGVKCSVDGGSSVLTALFQNTTGLQIPSKLETPDFVYSFFGTIIMSNTGDITITIDTSAFVSHSTLEAGLAAKQNIITAERILFGNGAGDISTAVAGTDYGYPLLKGTTDPTNATAAEVGQHYFNTATGKEFACTAAAGGVYTWVEAGGGESALAAHDEDGNAHEGRFAQSVQGYGTCATTAATAAKVGVLSGFELAIGSVVGITFTYANTNTAPTLDVNGTGAKPIYCKGAYVTTGMITAGMTALLQYNGTQWVLLNPANYAPTSHASATTDYGVGTDSLYGHVKTINALTQTSHLDGTALSAYQGYLLDTNKAPNDHASSETKYGIATGTLYGHIKATAGNGLTLSSGLLALTLASSSLSGTINSTNYNYLYRTYCAGVSDSSAVGYGALNSNAGSGNTAGGSQALYKNTTGVGNVGIGWHALYELTTGSYNISIGYQSGAVYAGGNIVPTITQYCSFLGALTGTFVDGISNSTVIGYNATASASNQITLGNASITSLRCQVTTITALSDKRIKEDVEPADTSKCLESVIALDLYRYKYKDFTGTHLDNHVTGWMADDVEKVFPKAVQYADEYFPVLDEDGNRIKETIVETIQIGVNEAGKPIYEEQSREVDKMFLMEKVKNITMSEATPTLWGAVQRLYEITQEQAAEIAELKEKIA